MNDKLERPHQLSASEAGSEPMPDGGGFVCPLDFGLIEVAGADAARFLQARTTNDVLALQNGRGQKSALLDRKAHVEAIFALHKLADSYWIVAEREQMVNIAEQLNRFLFNEKAQLKDWSDQGRFAFLCGLTGRKLLCAAAGMDRLPPLHALDIAPLSLWGMECYLLKNSITGQDGFFVWCKANNAQALEEKLRAAAEKNGLRELSASDLERARIEAGVLRYGPDVTIANLLPETGLEEEVVSYTKGCYPGQEVIARIKTFGAPRQGICGLQFEPGLQFELTADATIYSGGKEIGTLKSSTFSSHLNSYLAFAYLTREYRVPGKKLKVTIDAYELEATVTLLPFKRPLSAEQEAHRLYEKALSSFTTDEMKAIELLRDALLWDPLNADCYETLGVILARQDQLEEAIALMIRLSELDPDSVMAHANLSVFYMQKGDKEAAEQEKALAASIRMKELARQVDEKNKQEVSEKQKQEEALSRMEMFKQVLEIDPLDLLANCGLGGIHVELSQFEEAIPLLEKAIAIKPTHTVAYVALAAAYSGSGDVEKARAVYKRGIEVASQRGDMTPLKEMQTRLYQLEQAT